MKLCTAKQMRGLDDDAINEYHIPSIVLMENAGRGVVEAIVAQYSNQAGKRIAIFVGPGNNGGDGLVIARHLHQRQARVEVYLLVPPERLNGDTAANLHIVTSLSIPIHTILDANDLTAHASELHGVDLVVDSLFGTGLSRRIEGLFEDLIRTINRLACPIVAVDIPSGLDGDTGNTPGECVHADLTVTFGLAKLGLVLHPGIEYAGVLRVVDIGIPMAAVAKAGIKHELLDHTIGSLLPKRPSTSHKGNFGHLLVLAGSIGKTGAALLTGLGALRCGTGLVTMVAPHDLDRIFATALLEAMTLPLHHSNGVLSIRDEAAILAGMGNKTALVVGPGLGLADETAELVLKLFIEAPLPMVVDADALNILAQSQERPHSPANGAGPRIITPHPGEMARLLKTSTRKIQADRVNSAAACSAAMGTITVLKGAGTVISHPDGRTSINPTGNPGMASGGMGDVLAGVIAGFLAQGVAPGDAARLGVYLHGLAGDRLAAATRQGFLASEVADEIPAAMTALRCHSV